ncbi:hypothetical protein IE077_001232, partial [Cardiosporidium cionae]
QFDEEDDDCYANLVPPPKVVKPFPPAEERRNLQQREALENLEKELGKTKIVTPQTAKRHQGGYWCDTCACLMKDSQGFLDHINGKKHNRILGMSMNVERISVNRVREKLASLNKARRPDGGYEIEDVETIQKRIHSLEAHQEQKKRKKKRSRHLKDGDDQSLKNVRQELIDYQVPAEEDVKSSEATKRPKFPASCVGDATSRISALDANSFHQIEKREKERRDSSPQAENEEDHAEAEQLRLLGLPTSFTGND